MFTHVTLYAVDPSSSAAGVTEITDSTQLEFAKLAGDALTGSFDPFSTTADFDRLGPITGGRVVRGRNDIAKHIASSVELGDHFYTVAYIPQSTSNAAARFRTIRVVYLRPGAAVTTRAGYYGGQTEQQRSAAAAAFDLTTAAESPSALNGLSVSVSPDAAANPSAHFYVVRAGVAGLTWKPQPDGSAIASVYVMGVSLDAKNRMIDHTLRGMTARARAGVNLQNSQESANFAFTVVPAKSAATLRIIVRDSASGRMGSADLSLAH